MFRIRSIEFESAYGERLLFLRAMPNSTYFQRFLSYLPLLISSRRDNEPLPLTVASDSCRVRSDLHSDQMQMVIPEPCRQFQRLCNQLFLATIVEPATALARRHDKPILHGTDTGTVG